MHAAVAKVPDAVFEGESGPDCYAYVRGGSAPDAMTRVQREGQSGPRRMMEADNRSFFDTIPQERLMRELSARQRVALFLGFGRLPNTGAP